jgi:hypothetical protein
MAYRPLLFTRTSGGMEEVCIKEEVQKRYRRGTEEVWKRYRRNIPYIYC